MPEILHLIADARRAAFEHHFDKAAGLATEALQQLPSCLPALRILAWAQLEREDDDALQTFERCAAHDPEDALACVGQAIWYQQRRQNDLAIRKWIAAWEVDPQNQAIRRALVKLTGELPESPLAEAIHMLRAHREDVAVDMLRRLRSERSDATIALKLMAALWTNGARREAFELALNVYARHPESVAAALYVAAMEDRAGRTLRSREVIARAEQVDPGLMVFADVVRQVGLQTALDLHRASRPPLATAR